MVIMEKEQNVLCDGIYKGRIKTYRQKVWGNTFNRKLGLYMRIMLVYRLSSARK